MLGQVYLRDWARDVGVPILSVDYSLAPQAPYPAAMHECFFAYVWYGGWRGVRSILHILLLLLGVPQRCILGSDIFILKVGLI